MNHFLQQNIYAIIIFLLLFLLVFMGAIVFILFKLALPPKEVKTPLVPTNANETLFDKEKFAPAFIVESHYCIHHPDTPSVGSCLICEEVFCTNCLVDHESMHFCKEHFRVFANSSWTQITDVRTTPDTPEDGLYIYNFKRFLWLNRNIPSFVMTHYKINIDSDFIESFIQLNVRSEDEKRLLEEIKTFQK